MVSAPGHLIKNVFKRPIFGFIVPMLFAVLLLYYLPIEAVSKILLFAVSCFLWSMLFSLQWSALPKHAADFWYYLFAGVGAVLFFANASDQRQKLALAQQFNVLNIEISELNAKRKRIENAVKNPSELFEKVKELAGATARVLDARKDICKDVEADRFVKKLRLDVKERAAAPHNIDVPRVDLNQGFERFCDNFWFRSEFYELTNLSAPSDLTTFLRRTNVKNVDQAIGLKLEGLTLEEFAEYLIAASAGNWDRQATDIDVKLKKITAEYSEIGRNLKPKSDLDFAQIQHLLWPYLILMALAIKLARVRYCGSTNID